jgi:hypothetical protein
MKKLSLLLAIFLAVFCKVASAQVTAKDLPYDAEQKKIIYSEVVQTPDMTKDKLYDRAIRTLTEMYKYAGDKMAVKDKENGKIVLNGFVRVLYKEKNGMTTTDPQLIKYKMTLLFKEGKYKYEITDFIMDRAGVALHIERLREHNVPGDKTYDKEFRLQEKLDFIAQDIDKNIKKLKAGMASDKVEEKKDW